MKFTALAVTAIVAVASVASANEYQPALRALAASEPAAPDAVTFAADPTNKQSLPVEGAGATRKEFTDDENVDSKSHRSGGDDRDGDVPGEVLDGDVPGVDTVAAGEVDTVADGDGRY